MNWRKYNGEYLEDDIVLEVEKTLIAEKAKGFATRICIGTDSQVTGEVTEYATVIVFLRELQGGFMYIFKEKTKQMMSVKERMISEVSRSVAIAYELKEVLEKHNIPVEVHADINTDPVHKSNSALQTAMGYIKGMGFEFRAKPEAFASSYCADKMI